MNTKIKLIPVLLLLSLNILISFSQESEMSYPTHGTKKSGFVPNVSQNNLPVLVRSSILLGDKDKKDFSPIKSNQWIDSKGTEFWICFQKNYNNTQSALIFRLYLTSQFESEVIIELPGLEYQDTVTVYPNEITTVDLPFVQQLVMNSSEQVEQKSVYIRSDKEITVYGLNRMKYTTDAFLALPLDILNTSYIAVSYPSISNTNNLSQFAIVSPYDGNEITIIPNSLTLGGRNANETIHLTLNRGEVYQVQAPSGNDLTDSIIQSSLPVAVFSGHSCANIPQDYGYCDHLVEQLPPTNTWGSTFITYPLEGRGNGDTWRIISSQDNTIITLNGEHLADLNFGDYYEFNLSVASVIASNNPIMVMQFSNGNTWDPQLADNGDPFMMLIPPMEQFMSSYTFSTPANDFLLNYVTVTLPSSGISSILLDNIAIDPGVFKEIASTGYSAAAISVDDGSHHIESIDGTKFGIYSYGFWADDSYGYPGGFSLEFINEGGAPKILLSASTYQLLLQNQVSNQSLHIEAEISDEIEPLLSGARVFYRTVGQETFSSVGMINSLGTKWIADIPANEVLDPGFEFYISATDGQLTTFLPDVNHAKNPFSIAVLPNLLPVVTHEPIHALFLLTDNLTFKATVTDETNFVNKVWLNYLMKGGNPAFQEVQMTLTNGTYEVTIPGGSFNPGIIEYYISAMDDFGVRADCGTSSQPFEIEIFEELPLVSIYGFVKDLELTQNGSLVKFPVDEIHLDLYAGLEKISSLVVSGDGSFTFTDLVYREDYSIICRTTIDLPGNYEDVDINLKVPDLSFNKEIEIVVPKKLLQQKYSLMNDLEHLTIKSDLLFGLLPPMPIGKSYDQEAAFNLLSNWIDEYSDNYDKINNAIGRLLIVDQLLNGFYNDASEMSHATFVALLECIDGFFKTQKVLNDVHRAITQLSLNDVYNSVINELYVKINVLIMKLFIETPLDIVKSACPEPYSDIIAKGLNAMVEYVLGESKSDATFNVIDEFIKDEFKNAIVTVGDDYLLSYKYVPVTQKYFDIAVEKAKSMDFSGTIELAFRNTVSKDETDNYESYFEVSEDETNLAKSKSENLQLVGSVADKISLITGYGSFIPGFQVLKSISIALRGVSMAGYGSAALVTALRYSQIVNEGESAINECMSPTDFSRKSLVANEEYSKIDRGYYSLSRIEFYKNQLLSGENKFLTLLDDMSTLISQDNKNGVMDKLSLLMDADYELNGYLTRVQAPIWAAAEVSFREDEFFEPLFSEMSKIINKSQADRINIYSDLLEYFVGDDFLIDQFKADIDSVRNSFENTEIIITTLGDWVSDVAVPPIIVVSNSCIDKKWVGKGESFILNAIIDNMGISDVSDIKLVLKIDSTASIISETAFSLESLAMDETKNFTWTIRQNEILETPSFYTIELSSPNAKCLSGVGTYLTGSNSLYLSSAKLSPVADAKLTVFPNPSNEFVNIRIPYSEGNGKLLLRVYNVIGDLVYSENEISGETYIMKRNNLSPGFYIIELQGTKRYRGTFAFE